MVKGQEWMAGANWLTNLIDNQREELELRQGKKNIAKSETHDTLLKVEAERLRDVRPCGFAPLNQSDGVL